MDRGYRTCQKCGGTHAKFYIKEEPAPDRPFYVVVFICEAPECNHEWEESIHEMRILRKIKSQRYREGYEENVEKPIREKAEYKNKLMSRGLSKWEIERRLKLKIRKIAGFR